MTDSPDPRTAYWNETYLKYWQSRVQEAKETGQSEVQKGDARTEGDWVYVELFNAHPPHTGTLLDVGCAWGRMFPIYLERGLLVSGVDISPAMIDAAKDTFEMTQGVQDLRVAIAETLPFADGTFDNLVCVAVFDATYQHRALTEFLRVLRTGGRLYLTGKNTDYRPDDALAIAAEQGARAKGHPNSFTDLTAMVSACETGGCKILDRYFFEKRGDFAAFDFHRDASRPFYEWLLVIEKGADSPIFSEFSSTYSRTFRKLHPEEYSS